MSIEAYARGTAQMRRNNRNRVYRKIYESPQGITKQELAHSLALSLPTVLQNVKELLAENLLQPGSTAESTGGRKAQLLHINAKARFAVGISVTSHHLRFLAIDLSLQELAHEKVSYLTDGFPFCELAQSFTQFLAQYQLCTDALLGIGIAIPGIVNDAEHQLEISPTLHAENISLAALRETLPAPVFFINDANAGGFAEWWDRPQNENLAYLSIDKGVGGAVLLHGQPYTGDTGRSGEFGHMCIVPNGPQCSCGQRGCLEALCSTDRLGEDLGLTPDLFFERLQQNDPDCYAVWEKYLHHLALGIRNVCLVLDCNIVLGGLLAQYIEPYLPALEDTLRRLNSFSACTPPAIRLCRHRSKGTCMGAALHFIHQFFEQI